jgi:putative ABC transport system ATP-binding protein
MSVIIEGRKIVKEFVLGDSTVRVLDEISISVEEGEFVSIMGSSGSGKSTLLYLLGGLDKPTSGEILIKNRDISKLNDLEESIMRRRDIGFVFQFYNLIPNLSVEENVLLPVLLDGKKASDNKLWLNDILEIVGLSDRKNHTPRELSGGQQQRVAIARALMNNPDIILADEPIGNLDSKTGLEIMELFKKINYEKKKTIIQVTHSLEASAYGQRTIRVKDGKLAG